MGSRTLFVESATGEPPTGAAPLSVTVHVVLLELAKAEGAHVRVLSVGGGLPGPVTTAPVPERSTLLPVEEDATVLLTANEVLMAPWAIVRLTTATTPSDKVLAFMPDNMQVYVPEPAIQLTVLPASLADCPAVAEMAITFPAGYVNVHSRAAAGSLFAIEDRLRPKETVPFVAVAPDDRIMEPVCP